MASVALAAAIACGGCGYTEVHQVPLHAPIAPTSEVEVYMAGQAVPRPFYEVALLQVIGHGAEGSLEDVVKAMSRQARGLGCDVLASVTVDSGYTASHGFGVCGKYMGGSWAQPYVPTPAPVRGTPAGSPPAPPPAPPPPAVAPAPASP